MACALMLCFTALSIALAGADKSRNLESEPLQCLSFEAEVLHADMAGTLLAEKPAATIDGCCVLCEEEDRCEGFAYSNQTCYLKADSAGTFHKAGVVSRLKKGLGSGCVGFVAMQQGKDLVGELLGDWAAPNPEVCCAACADKPDCQGFAFLDERCYLKGDVRGTYDHEGCMVRVKEGVLPEESATPALPQCPHFEIEAFDTDMAGSLLAQREAATSDGCCPMCEELGGCEGFAYFEQVCYLKGNFSGTFQKAGVVSRVERGLGSGCPGYKAAEQGKDLVGELLDAWSAPNPEVCCAACAERPDCQGFAFFEGRCYLKGNVLGTYDHDGCMIQVKEGVLTEGGSRPVLPPVLPRCPQFEMQASDTDMVGALLAAKWAATSDGCCPLCAELDGCEGFAYFEQVCYLKGNFSGTFQKAGVVSRIKRGLGSGCPGYKVAEQGKDLVGELLDAWSAPNPEVCCAACAKRPDCQGFAFLEGRCYLKGNVLGTYDHDGCMIQVKEGVLAEGGSRPVLPPVLPQCPQFEMQASDTDMVGALLAAKWAATSDGCCPLCEEVDGCEGFAYFEQVCYLKGNFSGTFHKAGVLSRVKVGLGAGCPGFAAAQQGKDLVGELLDSWKAPKSDACCAACAETPECQGFAFVGDWCYLKGNVNGTYDHDGCMVRTKVGVLSEGGGDRRLRGERFLV